MEIIEKIRAEIRRRFSEYNQDSNHHIQAAECASILDFLDSLEVEEKETPELEEELDRFIASGKSVTVEDYGTYKVSYHDFKKVARHFYELGKNSK